jgi:hypothetical protein
VTARHSREVNGLRQMAATALRAEQSDENRLQRTIRCAARR